MNKIIDWIFEYKILTVVIVIGICCIISWKSLWHYLDAFITVGTLIAVWYNYNENKKQLDIISIELNIDGRKVQVDSYLIRRNFTRSEIKGILRGLCDESEYKIFYIDSSKSSFLKDIHTIQTGDSKKFEIPIESKDEFTLKKDNDDLHKTNI